MHPRLFLYCSSCLGLEHKSMCRPHLPPGLVLSPLHAKFLLVAGASQHYCSHPVIKKASRKSQESILQHKPAQEFHFTGSVFQPLLCLGTTNLYMGCLLSEKVTEKADSRFMFEAIHRKGIFHLQTRGFASPRSETCAIMICKHTQRLYDPQSVFVL